MKVAEGLYKIAWIIKNIKIFLQELCCYYECGGPGKVGGRKIV